MQRSIDQKLPTSLSAFFWYFIKKQKWQFAVLFLSTSVHTVESNVLPYAMKLLINGVAALGRDTARAYSVLTFPICLFLGTWIGMVIVYRIQEFVATRTLPEFRKNVRLSLFGYIQGHSHAYFADNFAGSIASKIGDVPRALSAMIDFIRWRIITMGWVGLVAITWVGMVNWRFSAVSATWVIVHMCISYSMTRKVSACSAKYAADLTYLHGNIVDSITNINAVRLFAQHDHERAYIARLQGIAQESDHKALVRMWRTRGFMDIPLMFMYAATLILLVEGWKSGWVTAGDMVFVTVTMLNMMRAVWLFSNELPNFFSEIGVCNQALTIITKSHDVVDARDARPLVAPRGEIVFDNVHFQYIHGRDVFKDKNITIRAGEKVGLVGFSGSGKSTFVNLMLRLYDVEGGCILIDGQDIATVTQDSLHASIAMIPQDSTLFHRSLMENIRYGRVEATDEEVLNASKLAHCHEFISQLSEGYDSLVGERGIKLSGGQRQRIAIARAILKNAPILILDEATSSLDSVTEKYIQESLEMLMKDRTTIIIAHRLSTLAHMDRILVFEDGTIIEDDTHQALLAANGHYARLWNMQAGGFLPEDT